MSTSASERLVSKQERGLGAENLVEQTLVSRGWRPLRRRWRTPWAEVDGVYDRKGALLLVEVKARSSLEHLDRIISWHQRRRLQKVWQNLVEAYPQRRVDFCLAVVLPDGQIHWDRDFLT